MSLRAQKDLALARQRNPPLAKKQLTKKIADERNANKHAHEAAKLHPDLQKWIPMHREEVARSWLAAAEFSNAQIERVENLVKAQGLMVFDIPTIRSVVRSLNLSTTHGTNVRGCQSGPFDVEWSSELAGLKSRVTTPEELRAEQTVSQMLAQTNSAPAVFTSLPEDGIGSNQTFSQNSAPLPTAEQAAAIAAATARSALAQPTANGVSVSASDNAALVLSSSAPAAVQFVGTRAPAPPRTGSNASVQAGVKRNLDARQESAPDDGLNPEEPGESRSRTPKVSKLTSFVTICPVVAGGPDQDADADDKRREDRARLLHVMGYSNVRAHFFRPVRTVASSPSLAVACTDLTDAVLFQDIWGLVGLWRLRAVCRTFRSWSTAQLCLLPRVVALGASSSVVDSSTRELPRSAPAVDPSMALETLDLKTLSWAGQTAPSPGEAPVAALQPLPPTVAATEGSASLDWARCSAASSLLYPHGNQRQAQRIVAVVPSIQADSALEGQASMHVFEWSVNRQSESGSWRALPKLPSMVQTATQERESRRIPLSPTVCCLRDGRTLLICAGSGAAPKYSVLILAAGCSSWSHLSSLYAREDASACYHGSAALQLPDGKVLIAGGHLHPPSSGKQGEVPAVSTSSSGAVVWDPQTDNWRTLPPMSCRLRTATACMLPSGRVAVIGYSDPAATDTPISAALTGEVYDPVAKRWSRLPAMPFLAQFRWGSNDSSSEDFLAFPPTPAAVSIPGGLIVVGCSSEDSRQQAQLFDEASSRWYTLPK